MTLTRAMQAKAGRMSICGSCPMRGEVNDGSCAQDRQGADLLRQPRAGCLDHVASAAAWRLSRRAGRRIAARHGRGRVVRVGTYGDPAAVPARDLDRPAARRGKLDSLYPPKAGGVLTSRCKARTTTRCRATLESWTPHFPRGHGCGAHGQGKRDPMSSVQGSRRAHHLRGLPAMWWHVYQITKINRNPHALGDCDPSPRAVAHA
jgi:hypothetical protein